MKKAFIAIVFTTAAFVAFNFNVKQGHTNQAGAPNGHTGSPGDGKTCATAGCHTGSAVTPQAGLITSNIPGTGYVPGQTYTIQATIAEDNKVKFGFQVSPQDANGNKLGTMIVTNSTATQLLGGGKYMTHKLTGTGGSGSRTWSFDWTAPVQGTGEVTFYGAFNVTNNSGSDTGDKISTSTLTVQEGLSGIGENALAGVEVYPNPSTGMFVVKTGNTTKPVNCKVFSVNGSLVYSNTFTNVANKAFTVNLDGKATAGIYFVAVESDGAQTVKKIVVQ